jgi:hypothetical protein
VVECEKCGCAARYRLTTLAETIGWRGRIWTEPNPRGRAIFRFALPHVSDEDVRGAVGRNRRLLRRIAPCREIAAVGVFAPSPLAGEGVSVAQQHWSGEGKQTPLTPRSLLIVLGSPLPQGEKAP